MPNVIPKRNEEPPPFAERKGARGMPNVIPKRNEEPPPFAHPCHSERSEESLPPSQSVRGLGGCPMSFRAQRGITPPFAKRKGARGMPNVIPSTARNHSPLRKA